MITNVAIQTAPVYPQINLMGKEDALLASSTVITVPVATRMSTTSVEAELHASRSDTGLANQVPVHTARTTGVQRAASTCENVTPGVGGTRGTVVRDTARQELASRNSKPSSSSLSRLSPAANAVWIQKSEETRPCPMPINSGDANLAVTAEPRKMRRSPAEEAYLKMLEMEEEAEAELEAKKTKWK
jgi:hypothetical protein